MQRRDALTRAGLALAAIAAVGSAAALQAVEPPVDLEIGGSPVPPQTGEADPARAQFPGLAAGARAGRGGNGANGDGLPRIDEISEGFEKVISTADGRSFYTVWVNPKTQQMLAELPRGFERQRHFIATTVASGEIFAGLQAADFYVYWKRFDDRLALVAPQLAVRSTGEPGSKASVERIFTDRVLVDVPIVAIGPSGQPVIDLDSLLLDRASVFFGGGAAGLQTRLASIATAKAFPENIEIAYDVPDRTGLMKRYHYSISLIEGTQGFQPREADGRLGYFTTSYRDLGKLDRDEVATRYINRWHLEKADPKLKLSPPKEPIVYYVEHTVPVRYRRWVRAGVEYWNEAYRNIGIDGAIEVRYQDASTGAHMDKDPEDVRYNFIRWLNNDISTAIGPSRVNPLTGEILDADVVLTDGWLRVFEQRWSELLPMVVLEGMSAETLEWLERNPQWDPRVRLASPEARDEILAERRAQRGVQRFGGHPLANVDPALLGDDELDGLVGRVSQVSGACMAATGKAMSLATARMHTAALGSLAPLVLLSGSDINPDTIPPELLEELRKRAKENPAVLDFLPPDVREQLVAALDTQSQQATSDPADSGDDAKDEKAGKADAKKDGKAANTRAQMAKASGLFQSGELIDGVPVEFVGPMMAELVAHEVGHTLGLRHNFKGSSVYTFADINSDKMRGKTPWSASVMDYNGVNIRMPADDGSAGERQGDFSSDNIGPYDMWVIEFGYSTDRNYRDVLKRAGEPELAYGTDEDQSGPDPTVRTYDLSSNVIDWARNQMRLVKHLRETLLSDFVKDGETWARARQGYQITLNEHLRAVSTMARWVGGAYVNRDKKGDPGDRDPITPVPSETQREALAFVIDNTFNDEAFGLSPQLLRRLTIEKWDLSPVGGSNFQDNTLPVHDQILGVQATAMTLLLNPTTLRRLHDNTFFMDDPEGALTVAEAMTTIKDHVWQEFYDTRGQTRRLEVSSLRQNLQLEHVDRLIDLTLPGAIGGAAGRPVAALAAMHLRDIKAMLTPSSTMPEEVRAHLAAVTSKIERALDAQYIYNTDDLRPPPAPAFIFGQPADREPGR